MEISKASIKHALPTVFLNCVPTFKSTFPSVIPADLNGAYQATATLLERGYTRIAFINGESYMMAAQNRLAGYRQALLNYDQVVDESLITYGGLEYEYCIPPSPRDVIEAQST